MKVNDCLKFGWLIKSRLLTISKMSSEIVKELQEKLKALENKIEETEKRIARTAQILFEEEILAILSATFDDWDRVNSWSYFLVNFS